MEDRLNAIEFEENIAVSLRVSFDFVITEK